MLPLPWEDKRPRLRSRVDLPANRIDALELTVAEPIVGAPQVSWGIAGESGLHHLHAERSTRDLANGARVYRFAVAEDPEWKGRIAVLGIDPTSSNGEVVRLIELRATTRSASPSHVAQAAATTWKVDLDRELRNAFLTPIDAPRHFTLRVDEPAELRFGYGVLPGIRVASATSDETQFSVRLPTFRLLVTRPGEVATRDRAGGYPI